MYRGPALAELRGHYVFGDFASGRIWGLEETDPGSWKRSLLLDSGLSNSLASFGEDLAGELYVMDLGGGRVLRLVADEGAGDAACIEALNGGFEGLARAQARNLRRCFRDAARDRVPDLLACVEEDRGDRRQRAEEKTRAQAELFCAEPPEFGPPGPDEVVAGAAELAPEWLTRTFGADPDAALLDDDGERCQRGVLAGLQRCEKLRVRSFNRCKTAGLGDGSIGDAEALGECLDADPRGRVERLCGPEAQRVMRALERRCRDRAVALDSALPGCGAAEPAATAACLDRTQRCALCLALSAADDLALDCDLYDDGAADASCP